jgi:hypothetical protein
VQDALTVVLGRPREPLERKQGSIEFKNAAVLSPNGTNGQDVLKVASAQSQAMGVPYARLLSLCVRVVRT